MKNKIRKTELIYFSKGNRYEYNIYLKNTKMISTLFLPTFCRIYPLNPI
ncbi:hypothetical protein P7H60_03295 [Vagococcus carniphilus]|nr:hypothetical protein [Vagococcus carniphilus]MDT2813384.1 hypothetical protein [Vagococcus carniphilus]MDT2830162.1 hypothetical protein [Vagococcus carniphilus]MDT2838594.1 hypothetical protein [Vagococcus carniphilus]MDT2848196.1 hypothetical protein [Vagococcus carniphilus]MDT2853432.1 hypothetical protein [Vagococcus carniphilus]